MITDAFPREKLGRAFSVYNMGISIGAGTALLVGALVALAVSASGSRRSTATGRRSARLAVPVHRDRRAGLLLPLLLLAVRDPKRRGMLRTATTSYPTGCRCATCSAFMQKNRHFYGPHFIAMAMMADARLCSRRAGCPK
jgi:MFS family permease